MIYEANANNITKAANALRQGRLAAFPTETVYGLGANAFNEDAVKKIFEVKGRPSFNPLIVHLYSLEQLSLVAEVKDNSRILALVEKLCKFMPGPLSLVVPKKKTLPACVTGGLDSVAIRIPSHKVALELLKEVNLPIAAPSANPSCYVSPTAAKHVEEQLGSKVDIIIDGGDCTIGLESTVLSLITDPASLLRPGAVTIEDLEKTIGHVSYVNCEDKQDLVIRSPGMLSRHYSPRTKIAFRSEVPASSLPKRTGLISFVEMEASDTPSFSAVSKLSSDGTPEEIAKGLFAAIREQDELGLDLIIVDSCTEEGLGLAIMDRLKRAANKTPQKI